MSRRSKLIAGLVGGYAFYGILSWHMFCVVQPQDLPIFIVTSWPLVAPAAAICFALVFIGVVPVDQFWLVMYPVIGILGLSAMAVALLFAGIVRPNVQS